MELPEEFTSFCGLTVPANGTLTVKIPDETSFCITNIAIGETEVPPTGRPTLYLKTNYTEEVAIVPFIPGRFESTMVDLNFIEKEVLTFRNDGSSPIQCCGYLIGAFELEMQE